MQIVRLKTITMKIEKEYIARHNLCVYINKLIIFSPHFKANVNFRLKKNM